jgi:hypothetical protein
MSAVDFLVGLAAGFIMFPVIKIMFWPKIAEKLQLFFNKQVQDIEEQKKLRRKKQDD